MAISIVEQSSSRLVVRQSFKSLRLTGWICFVIAIGISIGNVVFSVSEPVGWILVGFELVAAVGFFYWSGPVEIQLDRVLQTLVKTKTSFVGATTKTWPFIAIATIDTMSTLASSPNKSLTRTIYYLYVFTNDGKKHQLLAAIPPLGKELFVSLFQHYLKKETTTV